MIHLMRAKKSRTHHGNKVRDAAAPITFIRIGGNPHQFVSASRLHLVHRMSETRKRHK